MFEDDECPPSLVWAYVAAPAVKTYKLISWVSVHVWVMWFLMSEVATAEALLGDLEMATEERDCCGTFAMSKASESLHWETIKLTADHACDTWWESFRDSAIAHALEHAAGYRREYSSYN